MDLLGFKNAQTLAQAEDAYLAKSDRLETDIVCLRAGWTPWIGETSPENAEQMIDAVLSNRDHIYPLYPPGYTEPVPEPVITEGKLQVDPEPKKRGWFW